MKKVYHKFTNVHLLYHAVAGKQIRWEEHVRVAAGKGMRPFLSGASRGS